MNIVIDDPILAAAPGYRVLLIEADVVNVPTPEALRDEILRAEADLRESFEIPDIARRPAIAATRAAYKALGKEPNRYRPSAEALARRVLKGLDLYRIDALVDIINLVSLRTGISIGGFDADKIAGDTLTLGVGREGEPFDAIGRGQLNIACLPVFRDSVGPIGTPTSDNERTKLTLATRRLLATVNLYDPDSDPAAVAAMLSDLLSRYASAGAITAAIIG